MARNPRSRKKDPVIASRLASALDFVSVASKKTPSAYTEHAMMANNWLVASDGVLSAGHMIDESLVAYPHTGQFRAAMSKCAEGVNITQLTSGRLSIKSERLSVVVPCIEAYAFPPVLPDLPIAVISDALKPALEAASLFTADAATRVVEASVMLGAQTAIGTNGHVMVEAWHGIDLPPGLILPKSACNVLSKIKKPLARFGYTDKTSATFYYEDGSWIKTQLYAEGWPDVSRILADAASPQGVPPVHEGLYEGIAAILPFIDERGAVYVNEGEVRTHENIYEGAAYEVPGLRKSQAFQARYLLGLRDYITHIDMNTHVDRSVFFGGITRGVIMSLRRHDVTYPADTKYEAVGPRYAPGYSAEGYGVDLNEDIPF